MPAEETTDCTATSEWSLSSGRLSIESSAKADLPVRLVLVDGCTDETVLDRRQTFSLGDEADLDEHFETGRPYRFVLEIEGETRFDRTIHDHEGYQLAIRSATEVEVTGHVEA